MHYYCIDNSGWNTCFRHTNRMFYCEFFLLVVTTDPSARNAVKRKLSRLRGNRGGIIRWRKSMLLDECTLIDFCFLSSFDGWRGLFGRIFYVDIYTHSQSVAATHHQPGRHPSPLERGKWNIKVQGLYSVVRSQATFLDLFAWHWLWAVCRSVPKCQATGNNSLSINKFDIIIMTIIICWRGALVHFPSCLVTTNIINYYHPLS